MKKLLLSLLMLSGFTAAFAQKTVPEIKEGTNMFTSVVVGSNEVPVLLTIGKATGAVAIKWSVDGYGEGTFQHSEKGAENGTTMFAGQPGTGVTQLSDTETFGMISRQAFKTMVDTKSFTYGGMKFTQKTGSPAIKISGKEVDAFHVTSEDGKAQLWILNNPALPLVVQSSGLGMDTVITEIK